MKKLPVTNVVGVVKWRKARRLIALIKRHPGRAAMVGGFIVTLVSVGGFAYWKQLPDRQLEGATLVRGNGYQQAIERLESLLLPSNPTDRVVVYSQIAQSYEALEKYDRSLEYYLEAQRIVDLMNLDAQLSFYTAISDCYGKLHKPDEAAQFKQKAEERVKRYQASPVELPQKVEMNMEQS